MFALDALKGIIPAAVGAHLVHNRGLAYRNRGEVDRAIKDYDQALLLNSH